MKVMEDMYITNVKRSSTEIIAVKKNKIKRNKGMPTSVEAAHPPRHGFTVDVAVLF